MLIYFDHYNQQYIDHTIYIATRDDRRRGYIRRSHILNRKEDMRETATYIDHTFFIVFLILITSLKKGTSFKLEAFVFRIYKSTVSIIRCQFIHLVLVLILITCLFNIFLQHGK